eukprot:CAMPEP_0179428606 /NCGR_PEP_ID=MMETSP0799-20121207/14228_1 /TAXON_ID=46947 /ORGANISM="Geminigera cryophila, Strain CCMP2564" /LENGTH=542 /DNA_ID=CAMNT_0021204169 /DNA_START=141 /DNA_END=1769 /DNA_ORIENTATION=-
MPSDGVIGPSPRRAAEKAFASKIRATEQDYNGKIADLTGRVRPEVLEAASDWATMCAAVCVSGGAASDFSRNGGYPARNDISRRTEASKKSLDLLLDMCARKAPQLVKDEFGVLPLARLAVWVPLENWVRPLEEWEGVGKEANASVALRSITAHVLEKYETPEVLHTALSFRGDASAASVPEAAHRSSYAFVAALVAAGAGSPVREALNKALLGDDAKSVISKTTWKALSKEPSSSSPLHALRRAQVSAQNAPAWVGDAVCQSLMGRQLLGAAVDSDDGWDVAPDGLPEGLSEEVGLAYIDWVCKNAEELAEPATVATAVDYALQMRKSEDVTFSLAGRTPKTLAAAMDAYALTTVKFDKDEIFEPNPYGIKGLFLTNTTIPKGTVVQVPYDDPSNGGRGKYFLGPDSKEGRGARPATVRVAEIGSLRELIREGNKLNNCLENRYDSQLKYVMRARQRTSSFWSFTFSYEGDEEPTHVMLLEIWHLRQGNIVRQAEGPRPRTIPGPEAWYWMVEWCEREGVNWETWDIYSRVGAPVPLAPVL